MSLWTRRLASLSALFVVAAASLGAQQGPPEVVRGRVTDTLANVVAGATVMVTRGPDRLTRSDTTDAKGDYSVRFEVGTGDYLVYVSAPGFKATRRRVQRQSSEGELVADFRLVADVALLAAVKVKAEKPDRATNSIGPTRLETGASERWLDGINGQIAPTVAGDLSAIAATMSNVTMGPGGPSILGSGAESNLTTLNGMGLAAGAIPRAARTETRVTGASFDATRGGFAGANIDVRLGAGDRFYQRRNAFATLDPPALQFTDATGRALGLTRGGVRGSMGADGELIRQSLTYNVALDVSRSASTPVTLLDADAASLVRAGVAPDSVARLIAVTTPLGIPLAGAGVPTERRSEGITWLARLDDTRDTLSTRAFTTYAGLTRDGALGFGPLAAPSTAGERHQSTLGTQLTFGTYLGAERRILTETRFAASQVATRGTPYNALPGATVLVRSATAGTAGDVTGVSLGGGSYLATSESHWTLEGSNETTWNAGGRRHRFKGSVWARADGMHDESAGNAFGSVAYASIVDFAAGRPSSFSRTLAQSLREGTVWNTAGAIAHQWSPSRWFNLIYGARVEADGFASAPPTNTSLEQALGVRTGAAPMRLHVSPRVGFTYTYNRERENGSGTSVSPVGLFYRATTGTLRGGIGEFRDLLRPGILADASGAAGLPGGTSILSCVGAAVPTIDWAAIANGSSVIPSACVEGSGALAERAPAVTLIDPAYDVPRSWKASLDWSTSSHGLLLKVGALASYDLSQPGVVDANFGGVQQLTLPGEGGRPVYVSAAGIDPASGSVSAASGRRSDRFGRVATRVSDLRGYGSSLSFQLSPDVFKFRGRGSMFASVGYTVQETRRQSRGFDGAAYGDPRTVEWTAGVNDARHVVVLTGGFSATRVGVVTMSARMQSGLPFTPIVQGDVNGDGRGGDRAFIPNPDQLGADPGLAAQLRTLLATGSGSAVQCLRDNLGEVVARNGCRGPWTQSLNVQWRPRMPSRWSGRVTPSVYLQNVLAGVDQALHGDELRGWGSPATPDPVLLVPRGFESIAPGQGRFRYDVNPRFADTRPARTLLREPFRIVMDFSMNLSTPFDLQQLRRAVEPVREADGWRRRSSDSLTAFYLRNTSSIHKMLIDQADSLFLSRAQFEALQRADSTYSEEVRSIYRPLGELLARGEGNVRKAELDSVQATQKAYWKVFWRQPEVADSIVTPAQKELVPMLARLVAVPKADRENSQWMFGNPVRMDKPRPAPVVPAISPAPGSVKVLVP